MKLLLLLIVGAQAQTQMVEPIQPLPEKVEADPKKVALGDKLFHDKRLSKDGTISCASCHGLDTGGVDRRVVSLGVGGQKGGINSPTVFNSSLNFKQFWDGRAETLQDQAAGPVVNPVEMANTWPTVIKTLQADPEYKALFKIYKDGITKDNVTDAIATFEKTLITPSPFDRYLRGDKKAITAQQLKGYQRFKAVGCVACHQGVNIGGNMFQLFGVARNFFKDRPPGTKMTAADLGRYNVTKKESDKHHFKVPTLRNVALTAPYLHDGSSKTLEHTIRIMGKYQLGKNLSPQDVTLIKAFLLALTGEYKGKKLK